MLNLIKWFFYGFVFVLLWQIAQTMDNSNEQISASTLRLSKDLQDNVQKSVKHTQKNSADFQNDLADSVKQASQQYLNEMMK